MNSIKITDMNAFVHAKSLEFIKRFYEDMVFMIGALMFVYGSAYHSYVSNPNKRPLHVNEVEVLRSGPK